MIYHTLAGITPAGEMFRPHCFNHSSMEAAMISFSKGLWSRPGNMPMTCSSTYGATEVIARRIKMGDSMMGCLD
jgi:hypothetical protein